MFKGTGFRGIRRAVIGSVSALALGIGAVVWATVGASASAAPAARTAAAPNCATSSLSVWVDADQSNGAAGTIAYALEFTNRGSRACTLKGYPGVSATNLNGKQLGDAAGENPLFKATLVTIPAGGTAHADLFWSDGEVFTSGCKPTTASLIKVYPPASKTTRTGFFSLQACTLKKHTYLFTSVLRPGPKLDV
jgi:hypothetical protein